MKKLLFLVSLIGCGAVYAADQAGAGVRKLEGVESSPSKDPHGNSDDHKMRKGLGESRRKRFENNKGAARNFVLPPALNRVVKARTRLPLDDSE